MDEHIPVATAMLTVIVDGNNIMQALGLRRTPQIEEFLVRLEMAAAEKDWEFLVVFDGPQRYLPRETGLLVVRYVQGKTADSLIERTVYQARDRAQVVVVTQDRAEADLIRGFGARVWNSRQLSDTLVDDSSRR